MKKILIVVPSFGAGGTTTSLNNLLPLLVSKDRAIDIFPLSAEGEYYQEIAQYAKILVPIKEEQEEKKCSSRENLYLICGRIVKVVKRVLLHIGLDISPAVFKRIAAHLSAEHYDVVIAFQEGQVTKLVKYIKCGQKVAWIHSIYSRFASLRPNRRFLADYAFYDKIVCVSETAADDMRKAAPKLSPKIRVIYNAIDNERLHSKSKEGVIQKEDVFRIISVGRIDPVKRFSYIPKIAKELKEKGLAFYWTIVGGVADEDEKKAIVSNIDKYGVGDCVAWVGALQNPYPQIASSDILVCLSLSETFNYTIAEAKVLGVPVICTDFPAAKEFIEDKKTGIIVPIENIAQAIVSLYKDTLLYNYIKNKAMGTSSNWNNIVRNQIDRLFE